MKADLATEPFIRLEKVSKTYREGDRSHAVLTEANATIERGELIVVLGKSGSGKTTLLNLLAGIDLADAGRIVIDGVAVGALTERDRTLFRRHRIGFVFQFFNLIPTLTVEENLLLPLELIGAIGEDHTNQALALLSQIGLGDRRSSYPEQLSGGERQRVAIARALVHGPDLILADEPTGNLDTDTGVEVLDLLDRLVRRHDRTLVMATHSRNAIGVADRILRIDHGRILEGATEPAAEA